MFPHCVINLSYFIYQWPTFPFLHSDAGNFSFGLRCFPSRHRTEKKKKIVEEIKNKTWEGCLAWSENDGAQVEAKTCQIPHWLEYRLLLLGKVFFFLAVYVENLPKTQQWLWDRFTVCFFFSLSLSLHFFHSEGTKPPAFSKVMKNKPSSENEQVGHQVAAAADALMEVQQPRGGEHQASIWKWVCRVKANEIYQSWCCNCGRQRFYSAYEEPKCVSGEAFLPANDFWRKKKTISGNIKLPWKTLQPLMIIYEMNCVRIN